MRYLELFVAPFGEISKVRDKTGEGVPKRLKCDINKDVKANLLKAHPFLRESDFHGVSKKKKG